MFLFHIKRHLSSKLNVMLYCIVILYIALTTSGLIKTQLSSTKISVGIVNEDNSRQSQDYIDHLKRSKLLSVVLSDKKTGKELLVNEKINVLLTLPEHYFKKEANEQKLLLEYLSTDALAPTSLDLLAIDLMPYVAKKHLINASDHYLNGQFKESISKDYDIIYNKNEKNLNVSIHTTQGQSGTRSEQSILKIEGYKSMMLFALFILLISIVLPLIIHLQTESGIILRLYISPKGLRTYYMFERLASFIMISMPWLITILMATYLLTLKAPTVIFLSFAGLTVIFCYYEVLYLILSQLAKHTYQALFALSLIVIPAIFGGVFFNNSLLPPTIVSKLKWMPFNLMAHILDESLYLNSLTWQTILSLFVYALIGLICFIKNTKLKKYISS